MNISPYIVTYIYLHVVCNIKSIGILLFSRYFMLLSDKNHYGVICSTTQNCSEVFDQAISFHNQICSRRCKDKSTLVQSTTLSFSNQKRVQMQRSQKKKKKRNKRNEEKRASRTSPFVKRTKNSEKCKPAILIYTTRTAFSL